MNFFCGPCRLEILIIRSMIFSGSPRSASPQRMDGNAKVRVLNNALKTADSVQVLLGRVENCAVGLMKKPRRDLC